MKVLGFKRERQCKTFWLTVLLVGAGGCLGSLVMSLSGKTPCALCLWHRFLYTSLLTLGVIGSITKKRVFVWAAIGLLSAEVFVALGQVFHFLCPRICRRILLAEKLNLAFAAAGLFALLVTRVWRVKSLKCLSVLSVVGCFVVPSSSHGVSCSGRFVNPVTDVCWKCLFPIKIAGFQLVSSSMPDTPSATNFPICFCKRPGFPIPLPGIPVGFWEPARLIDVTKSPMCMVSMGGLSLGSGPTRGQNNTKDNTSFYHVHWYIYPVLYWLELLMDFMCLESASVDVAYLTEFDPLWNDDSKSTILNPEAILFGNPIAQGACIADGLAATGGLSSDALFWCSGAQGSLYPYTGNVAAHNGGVQASTLLLGRMIAKLHRSLLAWGYFGKSGLCGKYPMPIIRKSQYRYQMTYPLPETIDCKRIGQPEFLWGSGKEFPIKGEDFGYLLWRKRDCCLRAM